MDMKTTQSIDYTNLKNKSINKTVIDQFLEKYSIEKCQDEYKHLTNLKSVVTYSTTRIKQISDLYGEKFAIKYIEVWICNLNDFFNFNRKMNEKQIAETAYLIYFKHSIFSLAELNFVFTRIKSGDPNDFYQSIDGSKILRYFADFAYERYQILAKLSDKKEESMNMKQRSDFLFKNIDKLPSLKNLLNKQL